MRGDPEEFELVSPGSLAAALDLVSNGYRPLAGGTDVMVLLSAGKLTHRSWVDVSGLDELRGIAESPDQLVLGALTTYTELRESPLVADEFSNVLLAAAQTGGVAIQNRGTLGGNIGNASPAGDSLPALLSYDADIELLSRSGARRIPYDAFHLGYRRTALAAGEIISRIFLPRRAGQVSYARKVGPRQAQAISKVCFAGASLREGERVIDVRIAYGGVAPVPVRCLEAEKAIVAGDPGGALAALARAISPIDDVRSTARYRRRVAENLLRDYMLILGLDVELDG